MNLKPICCLLFILLLSACKKEDESAPHLTTIAPGDLTYINVISGGASIDNGPIIEKGICWSDERIPDITDHKIAAGDGNSSFSVRVPDLQANHGYYIRAYATNKFRTGYGNVVTIKTAVIPNLPLLTASSTGTITKNSAVCSGNITMINSIKLDSVGFCFSTHPTPTKKDNVILSNLSSGVYSYTTTLQNLEANTTYYARAFAATRYGTAYSDDIIIKTFYGSVTDYDGNVYSTVKIGNQEWTAQNLKVTHFNNGSTIPNVMDDYTWSTTSLPAYSNYNNYSTASLAVYGKLYNYYCVNTVKNIAPTGWHVASQADWQNLINTLGVNEAYSQIKAQGNGYWEYSGGTNESGLTVVGSGLRNYYGDFGEMGYSAYLWISGPNKMYMPVSYMSGYLTASQASNPTYGFSIRCVKD